MSKKELLARALDWTGMNLLARNTPVWNGLIVLNYHRIGDWQNSLFDHDLWSASAEDFEQQLRFLTLNFDLIRIHDLEHVLKQPRGRYVLITFDDGYRDNYEWAFPLLRAYNSPATFFLTTGFLDDRKMAWWDEISWMVRSASKGTLKAEPWFDLELSLEPEQASQTIKSLLQIYKSLPGEQTADFMNALAEVTGTGRCPAEIADQVWMDWEMVREMSEAGMDLGGHTVNHPVLANHPEETQQHEVSHCKHRIETEINRSISAFSYPVGAQHSFNQLTRECLEQAGYRWGFSYYGGYSSLGDHDPWDLPRIAIESESPAELFRSSVSFPQVFSQKKVYTNTPSPSTPTSE
ncbi:polysaccharide deacetylase family protein [Gimesia panareensis]|uniref:polysaccharide deacetylase family protein n=1 Tax=Gimesia panareensis TaxID=2527978 RepID=UPI0011884CEA|nr:polysaccharide deacetylase family protein [Gimesia panareensis]QDU52387.1 Polysaccharide deacetylase [Gimesia panareensis]